LLELHQKLEITIYAHVEVVKNIKNSVKENCEEIKYDENQ
jgi:hypothetical protein